MNLIYPKDIFYYIHWFPPLLSLKAFVSSIHPIVAQISSTIFKNICHWILSFNLWILQSLTVIEFSLAHIHAPCKAALNTFIQPLDPTKFDWIKKKVQTGDNYLHQKLTTHEQNSHCTSHCAQAHLWKSADQVLKGRNLTQSERIFQSPWKHSLQLESTVADHQRHDTTPDAQGTTAGAVGCCRLYSSP